MKKDKKTENLQRIILQKWHYIKNILVNMKFKKRKNIDLKLITMTYFKAVT